MDGNSNVYIQPWRIPQFSYPDTTQGFNEYDACSYPSPPVSCGQTMPDSPMQQTWTHSIKEQSPPSPYSAQMPIPTYMGSLSPIPPEMGWGRSHPQQHGPQSRSISRVPSFISSTSSFTDCPQSDVSRSDISRSASPNASEMAKWGKQQEHGSWRCGYPGCSSKSSFRRGCDLRKHYRRHTKSLFCRHTGCTQSKEGGFSSEKDRTRHEAKHNPQIACEWKDCSRVFSRVDNMVRTTEDDISLDMY